MADENLSLNLQKIILKECPRSSKSYAEWLTYLDKVETEVRNSNPNRSSNQLMLKVYESACPGLNEEWSDEAYQIIFTRRAVLTLHDSLNTDFTMLSICSFNCRRNARLAIAMAFYFMKAGNKTRAQKIILSAKKYNTNEGLQLLDRAECILTSNEDLKPLMGPFYYEPPFQVANSTIPEEDCSTREPIHFKPLGQNRRYSAPSGTVSDLYSSPPHSRNSVATRSCVETLSYDPVLPLVNPSPSVGESVQTTGFSSFRSNFNSISSLSNCFNSIVQQQQQQQQRDVQSKFPPDEPFASSTANLQSKAPKTNHSIDPPRQTMTTTPSSPIYSSHMPENVPNAVASSYPKPPAVVVDRSIQQVSTVSTRIQQPESLEPQPQTQATANQPGCVHVNGSPYWILNEIGRGGSSVVYCAMDSNKKLWAIKDVNLHGVTQAQIEAYTNEINVLLWLNDSGRVIRLHEHERTAARMLLVLELASVDLKEVLIELFEKPNPDVVQPNEDVAHTSSFSSIGYLPPLAITFYWDQMLRCVKALHDRRIVHLDLKPQNFVLVRGKLKLIDLGISEHLPDDTTRIAPTIPAGTFSYMSPEQLEDPLKGCRPASSGPWSPAVARQPDEDHVKIGRKSDIWSLGVILYMMVYGRLPFAHPNMHKRALAIADPEVTIEFQPIENQGIYQALHRCLVRNFRERACVDELLSIKYGV